MTAPTPLDTLGSAKYVSLTTYRADGTPVATPVWVVRDESVLRILTDPASGKVRRLRRDARVRLSPCDMRGRVKPGALVADGTAVIEDEEATARTLAMIERRYGLMGRILGWLNSRRARRAADGPIQHVGLRVTLADA